MKYKATVHFPDADKTMEFDSIESACEWIETERDGTQFDCEIVSVRKEEE